MQEQNSVDYDDIVNMATTESINDEAVIEDQEDEFEQFEQWVMDLGESSPLQSNEDQIQAIEDLNKMIAQAFPAGMDGTNAIQSLKGIIDDPNLYKQIKDAARQNPQEDVRPMIKAWVDDNATTIADQLDFGDMEQAAEEPAAEPEAGAETDAEAGTDDAAAAGDAAVAAATGGEEQVVTQGDDNVTRDKKDDSKDDLPFDADDDVSDKDEFGNTIKHKARHLARKGMRQAMDVKELAEFIQSFYDRDSGTFPKGPEGVCTMVGKKFGEQAEQVARKFVERMAPQQTTDNNPELAELTRVRELAGMNEVSISQNSYAAVGPEGYDYVMNDLVDLPGTEIEPDEENQMATVTILGGAQQMTKDAIKLGLEKKLLKPIADFSHRKVGGIPAGTPWKADKEESTELEDIRRLSGIAQGMGF
jgi:hypothetical protein